MIIGRLILLLPLLAACQLPPRSKADAATTAACRAEVDRTLAAQNRYQLSERNERDTPFAGSYNSGITSRDLGQRYDRDNRVAACTGRGAADTGSTFTPAPP